VGDSRAYLMRGKAIKQLTKDHTWVMEAIDKGIITPEQARDHPNVHVIRRYLGSHELPNVDFRMWLTGDEKGDDDALGNQGMQLEGGDTILLCSDGLTDLVWDDEILDVVNSQANLKKAADKLVALANERGGHDNITAVLLGMPVDNAKLVKEQEEKSQSWLNKLFRRK
jgi:protein phosphatase